MHLVALLVASIPVAVAPLAGALSANDHLRKRPLVEALERGFVAAEVEVRLENGELIVVLRKGSAPALLTDLYLTPLGERIDKNGGRVYRDGPEFTLFIKAKKDGATIADKLDLVLGEYRTKLTTRREGKIESKGLTVVLQSELREPPSSGLFFLEGRLPALDLNQTIESVPFIADSWLLNVRWLGMGPVNQERRVAFENAVRKAHSQGRFIRYWGTPDNVSIWAALQNVEVDWIGTENLEALSNFLQRHPMRPRLPVPKRDGDGDGLTRLALAESATPHLLVTALTPLNEERNMPPPITACMP